MTWTQNIQRGIVAAFEHRAPESRIAACIGDCSTGRCGRCGDLCPIKADRRIKTTRTLIVSALEAFDGPMLMVRYTKPSWGRRRGLLSAPPLTLLDPARIGGHDDVRVTQQAIEKALRRSLNKLVPRVVAVGMIDAWYGHKKWEIGAALIVAGATKTALHDAFPAATIEDVENTRKSVTGLLHRSYRAKLIPPTDAVGSIPKARQSEYYEWLAGMKPNARLFRYGCDRYFNPLAKAPKPIKRKVRKPRPNPVWLKPHQFGNHQNNCQCIACGGVGKHHRYR